MNKQGKLIMFYGAECGHCRSMDPLVERLEKETGIKIERLEVWHNEANLNYMRRYSEGRCTGVPFFFNEVTDSWICGAVPYDQLKVWATAKV